MRTGPFRTGDRAIIYRFSWDKPSWNSSSQGGLSWDRSSQVGTGYVKLGWPSPVKTGQVNLSQVKLSQDRSSQVGIRTKFSDPKSVGSQKFWS